MYGVSCMFGFNKKKTLVSYVPIKTKVVLLLPAMNYDARID
jgi:hypothetical protein